MTATLLDTAFHQAGHGKSFGPVLKLAEKRAIKELGLDAATAEILGRALDIAAAYLKRWSDSKPPKTWMGLARQFIIALL